MARWPSADEVLDRAPAGAAVVDPDPAGGRARHAVHHHEREVADHERLHPLGVVGVADRHEPVDRGVGQHGGPCVVDEEAGQQHEAGLGVVQHRRHADEELADGGVGEQVRQRLVDHEPDRARPPPAQAAGQRVGAGVAEALGGGQDPRPQHGRELIGTVVGVRDGRAGDTDLPGDVGQCRAAHENHLDRSRAPWEVGLRRTLNRSRGEVHDRHHLRDRPFRRL